MSSSGIRVSFSQQCSTSQWIAFPIRLARLDNFVANRFRADAARRFCLLYKVRLRVRRSIVHFGL